MRWHVPVLTLFLATGCVQTTAELPGPTTPVAVIDPKSSDAAAEVVRRYAAAIERREFATAASYWGDAAQASAFAGKLRTYGELHFDIGKPGAVEGAAGSSYVNVPVVVIGKGQRRAAEIILRRVNDIDGSSAAQRRWHIERVEWKPPA